MAIVVEDGTSPAGANSYVSIAQARQYAQNRGTQLPADDVAVGALLLDAMIYIEAQRKQFKGTRASTAQPLQWPRQDVFLYDDDDTAFPSDSIPQLLRDAQCHLALEAARGISFMAASDGRLVKRKKTDVLETEFMTAADAGTSGVGNVSMPAVDALLEPLLETSAGFFLTSVRV